MITRQFPGKLFLMGEYAVMDSGYPAVVAAIDKMMTFTIEKADTLYIQTQYGDFPDAKTPQLILVEKAYQHAQAYLEKQKINLKPFKMVIQSALEQDDKKIGLGSSAVVLVGVLDTILRYHDCILEPLQLFKLSVAAQRDTGSLSSGADLAATIFGGVLHYERYDVEWLQQQETLEFDRPWPNLVIEPLEFPYEILVGWTHVVNRTNLYLEAVAAKRHQDPIFYETFLARANLLTQQFMAAKTITELEIAIRAYRHLMLDLGTWATIEVETPPLTKLIEICEEQGLAAKISGSGGGDCGYVLLTDAYQRDVIGGLWLQHDIEPLPLKIWRNVCDQNEKTNM